MKYRVYHMCRCAQCHNLFEVGQGHGRARAYCTRACRNRAAYFSRKPIETNDLIEVARLGDLFESVVPDTSH
jgi:hypothetical protein